MRIVILGNDLLITEIKDVTKYYEEEEYLIIETKNHDIYYKRKCKIIQFKVFPS